MDSIFTTILHLWWQSTEKQHAQIVIVFSAKMAANRHLIEKWFVCWDFLLHVALLWQMNRVSYPLYFHCVNDCRTGLVGLYSSVQDLCGSPPTTLCPFVSSCGCPVFTASSICLLILSSRMTFYLSW